MMVRCLLLIVIVCLAQGPLAIASGSEVESGRSLVIVFDTTWSMDDDLQALRAGAAHIVKEMLKKDTNPIHSYVFVPFNDPCEYIGHWLSINVNIVSAPVPVITGLSMGLFQPQYFSVNQTSPLMESHYTFLPKLQQTIIYRPSPFQSLDRFSKPATRTCCCSTWKRFRCTAEATALR